METKYVDFDGATGLWCVFGTESGKAYSSWSSREDALKSLEKWS